MCPELPGPQLGHPERAGPSHTHPLSSHLHSGPSATSPVCTRVDMPVRMSTFCPPGLRSRGLHCPWEARTEGQALGVALGLGEQGILCNRGIF